jgi:hypothetical protein
MNWETKQKTENSTEKLTTPFHKMIRRGLAEAVHDINAADNNGDGKVLTAL